MAWAGRRGGTNQFRKSVEQGEFVPKVDKNPYYRTMDILNGVFRKSVKLEAGPTNATDLRTIYVNFSERVYSQIVELVGPGADALHSVYRLACGHEWEGKAGHPTNGSKSGPCWACGGAQSYLGFEHEWQHIIFKSDLIARKLFVEQYTRSLIAQAPQICEPDLQAFLSQVINAFDDLRCNSLWEKVYPGSAGQIWERWKRLTAEDADVNTNFIGFIFAVALGVPTDPQGMFEPLRPVVEWGAQRVRYRGFMNMMVDVRVILDRCMGTLLAQLFPPTPPMPSPPQASDQGDQGQQGASGEPDNGKGDSNGDGDINTPQQEQQLQAPSVKDFNVSSTEVGNALKKLMDNAKEIDEKEQHPDPNDNRLQNDPSLASARVAVMQAMSADIDDVDIQDQLDSDMDQAIQQLQDGLADKSRDSQLTSNAKARILIIKVQPGGLTQTITELTEEEKFAVSRMRSAFYRSLGREKAKVSTHGSVIDVPSLINYLGDHQNPEVFENEAVHQGFGYVVLTDMSGSMSGTFPQVCHAVEMLREALKFPFVQGDLWGFRGGEAVYGRQAQDAEVWLYHYPRQSRGYTGVTSQWIATSGRPKNIQFPVSCGGLTPMNSAINVVTAYLRKHVASSMAKRLFLLTDGSPCHTKINGQGLPDWMLRGFVTKEINEARKHGIQVYTLIIGEHAIENDDCRKMFGPYKFWKKVSPDPGSPQSVDRVLTTLILDNFTKYIKARG